MRVLLCGLGDIARKAYLPILASKPGLEVHLATRDPATLTSLGKMYRISGLHSSVDDALGQAQSVTEREMRRAGY